MPYYHAAITKKTGEDRNVFVFDFSREKIDNEIISPLKQQKPFMCGNSYVYPSDIENMVFSLTEETSLQILARTRRSRLAKRLGNFVGAEMENIDEWTIIRAGKDVTMDLTKELYVSEEKPELRALGAGDQVLKPEISKEELRNYLEEYLRLYRAEVKKRYSAYFNEFPFYSAVRAVGVISLHYVYIFFTKDGEPKKTMIEVFDETDLPELAKVKDAVNMKEQDIFELLDIKSYIPDLVQNMWQEHHSGVRSSFVGPSISVAVDQSIKNHYTNYVEMEKDPTYVVSGEHKQSILSKYSFVYNTMDNTALSKKIEEIFDKTEEGEILIAGWIDSSGVRLLNSLTKRNIKFRIITHRPSDIEKRQSPSDTSEIFSKLAKEHAENVRVLPKLHTRLLISDREALVSTADLTKESLGVKYEAGISTTDGLAIIKIKEFFEKLWEEGTKLSPSKTKG